MQRSLFKALRWMLTAAMYAGVFFGVYHLLILHGEQALPPIPAGADSLLFVVICIITLLLLPVAIWRIGLFSGYRLYTLNLLFVSIKQQDRLHLRRLKRPSFGVLMLPPRTDGTSPWRLYLFSNRLFWAICGLLYALAAALLWRTVYARPFIMMAIVAVVSSLSFLAPRAQGDTLLRAIRFRKNADYLRAWECSLHITAGLQDEKPFWEMPESWFMPYDAALMDDDLVRLCTLNRSSWLINHERETEAYEALQPLFSLTPAPDNHQIIAATLLNGAVIEALCDLPPTCLNQLEHPSIQYMTPPKWRRSVLTAYYARALLLHHDEQEASALLPELTALIEKETLGRKTLARLQKKAGLNTEEETHHV